MAFIILLQNINYSMEMISYYFIFILILMAKSQMFKNW